MIISSGDQTTHRSSRTAVDSGNTPSSWGDAPSSFTDMLGYNKCRVRVIVNSGTLTGLTLTPITIEGSNSPDVHTTQTMTVTSNSVEPADFSLAGFQNVYMKIESIAGTSPNITIVLQGLNKTL